MEKLANPNHNLWRQKALEVLDIETNAIIEMRSVIGEEFLKITELFLHLHGKIICSGVGKSGHIARKIAATLSSTGTPSCFMHSGEAGHGDLGVVSKGDALLLLSYSGESQELMNLIPACKRLQNPIVALVGNSTSTLAKAADYLLVTAVRQEACPHNLAPTASTTATLALADALAMTLLTARGFSPEDFALRHPSGQLGRRLLLRVSDVMRQTPSIPQVLPTDSFSQVLLEMTEKRMGMTLVVDAHRSLQGIFTDGDLRRAIHQLQNIKPLVASQLMNPHPHVISPETLAVDALNKMKTLSVNHLAVIEKNCVVGALSFHDLLQHQIL